MAERLIAGNRIRQRRMALGIKQAVLAQTVGISPAYLNLIEHNRRRIGGRLLLRLAEALDLDPLQISEGARAATILALQQAAEAWSGLAIDPGSAAELAERFPDWAALIQEQARRLDALTELVESLSDRLSHDPQLAAALHDILSVVTAVRSTAGILASEERLEPEWQARFHRNIYEDSQRLAESARVLVAYLSEAEDGAAGQARRSLPQEAYEAWLGDHGYHFPELEDDDAQQDPAAVIAAHRGAAPSAAVAFLMARHLAQYAADARALPLAPFLAAVADGPVDPLALAQGFSVSPSVVMRRLAGLPNGQGPECGLVQCDMSGAITLRRPIDGFAMPHLGAACPLWPLFQTLQRPQVVLRERVAQPGLTARRFDCFALAEPAGPMDYGAPLLLEATMLILPAGADDHRAPLALGATCRICPRDECPARREASITGATARAAPL